MFLIKIFLKERNSFLLNLEENKKTLFSYVAGEYFRKQKIFVALNLHFKYLIYNIHDSGDTEKDQRKKRRNWIFCLLIYGRFLLSINMITAPIIIITMIMATIPYIRVVCVATPVFGVDVGAVVGAGELA